MSATLAAPAVIEQEQRLDLAGVSWQQYVQIADALPERRGLKIIYLDGRLTFVTVRDGTTSTPSLGRFDQGNGQRL